MSEEKKYLLPCPFCGSGAMLEELGDHHGAYHNLGCSKRECPAHHAIYTESEAPVEDSVNWWNSRAALQESEAGAVAWYAVLPDGTRTKPEFIRPENPTYRGNYHFDGIPTFDLFTAPPQSAQAIETAAIMKCVEVCQKTQSDMDDQADSITDFTYKDAFEEVEARLKQLEQKCMEVAEAVDELHAEEGAMLHEPFTIRAIVTNLIGEKK